MARVVSPDGGWGWAIVFGSFIINFSTRSIEPSFGLLFGDLLKRLNVGTTGAGIIMCALDATINFSGLLVGPLVKKLSYRAVAVIGGIFSSVAMMCTARADSMAHILLSFSLIGGIGFGLATSSTYVGLNDYFDKKKSLAVGLAMIGAAIGFMAMPQIVSFLLVNFGFRGTLVIMSAICLHTFVGAALFQPVKYYLKKKSESSDEKSFLPKNEIETVRKRSLRRISSVLNTANIDLFGSAVHIEMDSHKARKWSESGGYVLATRDKLSNNEASGLLHKAVDAADKDETTSTEMSCWHKFSKLMDFHLLKDPVYLNILFGMSITYVAELNFKMVIPFFLDDLGYNLQECALALSAMAVADIMARAVFALILDRIPLKKRTTLMIGCVFVAITRSIMAEQTKTVPLMVFFIAHGFFRGMTLINFPLALTEYATPENYPGVLGLSMVSKGIFIVVLGPLVGYIRDKTRSYPMSIHIQTLMITVCLAAWSIEYLFYYCKYKNKNHT